MEAAAQRRASPPTLDEYFELERTSPIRHEYHGDRIVAMSGGSANHAFICTNISGELRSRAAARGCIGLNGEMRVKVRASGRFFYPDASALCGKPEIDRDKGQDSLANPQLLVEVLSPTTSKIDHYLKFDHYSLIESLREYVWVEQDEARVTLLSRDGPDDAWRLSMIVGLDATVTFSSIGVSVPMRAIYQNVELPPPGPDGSVPVDPPSEGKP